MSSERDVLVRFRTFYDRPNRDLSAGEQAGYEIGWYFADTDELGGAWQSLTEEEQGKVIGKCIYEEGRGRTLSKIHRKVDELVSYVTGVGELGRAWNQLSERERQQLKNEFIRAYKNHFDQEERISLITKAQEDFRERAQRR